MSAFSFTRYTSQSSDMYGPRSPHTPARAQAQDEGNTHSSPLFGTPSSADANDDNRQINPAQRYVAPNRVVGVEQWANSDQFSDITIHYGSQGRSTFKGHKIILISSSLWFQAAFSNPAFDESSAADITLHDDDELSTFIMLQSCYRPSNNGYDLNPPWSAAQKQAAVNSNKMLLFHVEVYVVADKYDLPHLSVQAARHTARCLTLCLEYAVGHPKHPHLRAMIDLNGLLTRVYDVTAASDETCLLRKTVLDVILSHPTTKSTGPPGILTDEVTKCVREVEGFGRDMYIRTMAEAKKLEGKSYLDVVEEVVCPACGLNWAKPTTEAWRDMYCVGCGVARDWSRCGVAKE